MNEKGKFLNLKTVVAVLFCLLNFSIFAVAAAAAADGKMTAAADSLARSLAVDNLSAHLKKDLAKSEVSVKLSNVAQRAVAKNIVELKGGGVCVFDGRDDGLPIRFTAKINVALKTVSNVSYDFVEAAAPEYAPTSNEEFLMKELMKQISRDYRTENIVVALDGVEGNQISLGEKQFSGVGEVRIGDMIWNKIKFDVTVDANGRAKKIVYDVKK